MGIKKSIKHPRIGVYVCHCGKNIAGVVDVEKVRDASAKLPRVVVSRDDKYLCSEQGQQLIAEDIKNYKLERVVVASCSPRMHSVVFQKVMKRNNLNPYLLDMVNIRDHCSWVHTDTKDATEKSIDLVKGAVARATLLEELKNIKGDVIPSVLVIGAGIAGIYAALYLANSNVKTYLVERKSSIGGHMAMLDKTFPTLDCGLCILSPRMVEVAQHKNIELITYSDVIDVEGHVGDFKVKIRKKPWYVDKEKCVACGRCAKVCPTKDIDTFNCGYQERKAICMRYPQGIPNSYLINPDICRYLTEGKCGACKKVCDRNAINFDDKEEIIEINVGAVIIATGFGLYDPSGLSEITKLSERPVQNESEAQKQYGYRKYKNVITNLDFERMINASGFTGGKTIRLSDEKTPESVAFIQCVGSRNEKTAEHCSATCCMTSIKQAVLIKEKYPRTEIYVYYIDIRTVGRQFEEFYKRAREMGIHFIRGLPGELVEDKNNNIIITSEDTLIGKVITKKFDMVILASGMRPSDGAPEIAEKLHIPTSPDGFLMEAHPKLRPAETSVDGVFVAGCAQFPKDIPTTVLQAGNAAIGAMDIVSKKSIEIEGMIASIDKEKCIGCKMCEKACPYNAIEIVDDIAKVTDVLCKGCGVCAAACLSGAIQQKHFTDSQISVQIEAMME